MLICNEQTQGTTSWAAHYYYYYYYGRVPASRGEQHPQPAERCAALGGTQGALPAPQDNATLELSPPGDARRERLQQRLERIEELVLLSFGHWVEGPTRRFAALTVAPYTVMITGNGEVATELNLSSPSWPP